MKKLLHGNLLTTVPNQGELTKVGSILIPQAVKHYNRVEVVIPDKDNTVNVGDSLKVMKASGIGVDYNGKPHMIINKGEIIEIE